MYTGGPDAKSYKRELIKGRKKADKALTAHHKELGQSHRFNTGREKTYNFDQLDESRTRRLQPRDIDGT
ncbi:MAG: hypothetical protein WKF66_07315 [Pedobacter sp.]